jgi:hypothetical protein
MGPASGQMDHEMPGMQQPMKMNSDHKMLPTADVVSLRRRLHELNFGLRRELQNLAQETARWASGSLGYGRGSEITEYCSGWVQ